jgi:hypothetical protein
MQTLGETFNLVQRVVKTGNTIKRAKTHSAHPQTWDNPMFTCTYLLYVVVGVPTGKIQNWTLEKGSHWVSNVQQEEEERSGIGNIRIRRCHHHSLSIATTEEQQRPFGYLPRTIASPLAALVLSHHSIHTGSSRNRCCKRTAEPTMPQDSPVNDARDMRH